MHLKSTTKASKTAVDIGARGNKKYSQVSKREIMAATTNNNAKDENADSGGSGNRTEKISNNNTIVNNNNNEDGNSGNQQPMGEAETKLKRQSLEQRKLELERLLNEKNWLLQQIQKQEVQILNGNYEYVNVNEIFAMLANQYKKEHGGEVCNSGGSSNTAILRRKITRDGNRKDIQDNNNSNRQSEISNRSSEYDNYPAGSGSSVTEATVGSGGAQQQIAKNSTVKKHATNTPPPPVANLNYLQTQHRQQQLLQQQMMQNQLKYAALLQHQHYHQQQQQQQYQNQQQKQHQPHQQYSRHYPADVISLYSVNSANVATFRQQQIAPQQQPIVVQCDRYYLSPTHQEHNDGGFIKSSHNIKKYVSPMSSPTQHGIVIQNHQQHQQHEIILATNDQPQIFTLQQLQPHILVNPHHVSNRQLDAISLSPSYISVDVDSATAHNLRWRSQSNLPPLSPQTPPHSSGSHSNNQGQVSQYTKSKSSDMLSNHAYNAPIASAAPPVVSNTLKAKTLDEISISSLNSETQKSKPPKPKQWMESSLDGPIVRAPSQAPSNSASHTMEIFNNTLTSVRLPSTKSYTSGSTGVSNTRERSKLSSQSMSSARHYSMSSASHKHSFAQPKLLQDDDGRYAKLSHSTSYLNSMEPSSTPSISAPYNLDSTLTSNTIEIPAPPPTAFRYLPPKPLTAVTSVTPTPPPRPPPVSDKSVCGAAIAATPSALSPSDIRIESPKNVTVVKPATFRPYQEETKPFEMSDFYKYSTKFRQKESSATKVE